MLNLLNYILHCVVHDVTILLQLRNNRANEATPVTSDTRRFELLEQCFKCHVVDRRVVEVPGGEVYKGVVCGER